jgi:hypothetical protein
MNIVVFNIIIFIFVSGEGVVLKIGVGVPQVVSLNSPSNTVTLWVLNISNGCSSTETGLVVEIVNCVVLRRSLDEEVLISPELNAAVGPDVTRVQSGRLS